MLWDMSVVKGYAIEAIDGQLGTVSDFLLDDENWIIRWLVVDTGDWLSGRKVLLPPAALGKPRSAGAPIFREADDAARQGGQVSRLTFLSHGKRSQAFTITMGGLRLGVVVPIWASLATGATTWVGRRL